VTRRGTLAGLTAIAATVGSAAAGCRIRPRRGAHTAAVNDPARSALLRAIADEEHLIALYGAADTTLAPILRDHLAHHDALVTALGGGAASPTPTPVTTAGTHAIAELRTAERAARSARTADALAGAASIAPLLASIAACEARHEVLLRLRERR